LQENYSFVPDIDSVFVVDGAYWALNVRWSEVEIEREIALTNQMGMHLRVAGKIVKLLAAFDCTLEISFNGRAADAKSIMSMIELRAIRGSVVQIRAGGPDAARAVQALTDLFAAKFGED
jgi:phosphotransferase system HPr (HPr) family protein